jgi:hypothetical protein
MQNALANFAQAYRAYQIAKGRTFHIDVATQYATEDMFNQVKRSPEAHAIAVINDEAELLRDATAKCSAA